MDVRSAMTANPACCSRETPVPQVAQMMIDNDCGEIPVVDERGAPVGVITDRDITTRVVAQGRDPSQCTAGEAMSNQVQTVRADSDVQDAYSLMEDAQVRRVPVVDDNDKIVGMFALADLALSGKNRATAQTVREVSEPRH
ncbi:CBS domain-containing protein [Lysobacter sp. D1-1-M9]|uniref:CBS domain-containing protein n=2 Tax=Novilysobacter TaxID=3382699 RepID=UPI002FCBB05D